MGEQNEYSRTAGPGKTPARPAPETLATKDLALRIWREYVRPQAGQIVLAVVFMVIVAASTGGAPLVLRFAIRELFELGQRDMVLMVAAAIIGVNLVKAAATYGQAKIMSYVGQRLVANIQITLFRHLMVSDLGRLQSTHSGSFVSNFLYDANLIAEAVSSGITGVAKNGLTVIALFGVLLWLDWKLALIASIVVPFAANSARKLGKKMRRATTGGMDMTDTLSRTVLESLNGARTVKAFQQEEREVDRATQIINRRLDYMMAAIRARIAAAPVTEAITGFGIAGVISYAAYTNMPISDLMGFVTAMMLAYQPLKALSNLNVVMNQGATAARHLFGIIDVKPEIADARDAVPLRFERGEVRLENVVFHYTDETAALNGLSLEVPAGQTVALVGPSGAGKSTVFNLIPRFYDVTEGRVTIDGQDVRAVTLGSLRAVIAVVTQDPFLFDDTVCANIAYGRPGASQADIERAARDAAAAEFIEALPDGYETRVGEHGANLSGGQRQRIAIARAMLADSPILLLDEATSALDSDSERQVQDALRRLMKGRTTIVIAHRLSTIIDADRIYVLNQGRIEEQGTHQDLLARGGLYARLYHSQLTQEEASGAGAKHESAAEDGTEGLSPVPAGGA